MANVVTSGPGYPLFGNLTTLAKADVTAVTAWTIANSPVTIFTVTGVVLVRILPVTTTLITSTLNTGTLALGIAGNTTLFRGVTTADGSTRFIANTPWIDTLALANRGAALPATDWPAFILNGTNVILTVATNNMTAGAMTIYCQWQALSAGASVV